MKPVSNETVLQQLQWRDATKKFDAGRKIPDPEWKVLEESLVLTPSSYGLQPWKFFVVGNPETLAPSCCPSPMDRCKRFMLRIWSCSPSKSLSKRQISIATFNASLRWRGGKVENLAGFKKMMLGNLVVRYRLTSTSSTGQPIRSTLCWDNSWPSRR